MLRKPRVTVLNEKQLAAVQAFLPALLTRYREVAKTGQTDKYDPLCKAAGVGSCYKCPVFGAQFLKAAFGCSRFLPAVPRGVDDQHYGVRSNAAEPSLKQKARGAVESGRKKALAWGKLMVERLESWKLEEADL